MSPPRKIVKRQLDILVDFLETNRGISKGLPPGEEREEIRKRWSSLAQKLNSVKGGVTKTPNDWRKYWFQWRHSCKKKAMGIMKSQSNGDNKKNSSKLTELENRVLQFYDDSTIASISNEKNVDFLDESDSEHQNFDDFPVKKEDCENIGGNNESYSEDDRAPPPRWALELENRRIYAEERMAAALEKIANVMQTQEERRSVLEARMADAMSVMSGTVQDIHVCIQEVMQQISQRHNPL